MQEKTLRDLHRYLGAVAAPLILMQVVSGLMLSVDLLGRWQDRIQRFLDDADLPAVAEFWNTVGYEIHFGNGSIGLLHNVAVGVSLGLLVLTGLFIFVKVLARTTFKRLVSVPPVPGAAEEAVSGEFEVAPRGRVVVVLAVAALGLMALDVYIFSASYRMMGLHVPHLYAASAVEAHIARAHTALERVLAGATEEATESMRNEIERAGRAAEAMLRVPEAGERGVASGRRVLPVENRSLRRRVEGVAQGLRHLQEVFGETGPSGLDVLRDGNYRRTLDGLLGAARGLVESTMDVVEEDRMRFSSIHWVLFSLAFLFLVAVGAVLYFYESGRIHQFAALRTARDIAAAYEVRFREVVRQAATPVLVFDGQGQVVAASLTAAYLLGYSEEDLHTLGVDDIAPDESPAEREALWGELTPEAPAAAKSCWRHRDGTDIPVVLNLGLVVAKGENHPLVLVHAGQDPGAAPVPAAGSEGNGPGA